MCTGPAMSKGSGRRPEGARGDYRANKFWDKKKKSPKGVDTKENNPYTQGVVQTKTQAAKADEDKDSE